jgi:hypothetical protein
MATPNISYSAPSRKAKDLVVHFGCMVVPFYKLDEVAPEGAPVQYKSGTGDEVELVTPGAAGSGVVIGLTAQEVYDPSLLGSLANYEFHNDTRARKGDTIGVVTGKGWVLNKNYTGAVAIDDDLYPAASGKLSATQTGADVAVATAEEAGTDGDTLIRVRVDFTLV